MQIKRYLTLFAAFIIFKATYGQAKYEPTILILAPNEVTYDKAFEQEISTNNEEIKTSLKAGKIRLLIDDTTGQPENIKIMLRNEISFSQTLNFSKLASFAAEQYLCYVLFESFPNLLVILKDIKSSGNIADLKKIADAQQMQYILNFSKINIYKDSDTSKAEITIQLYDQTSNSLVINRPYIGDWNNPGGAFSCPDNSLYCTINNALAQSLNEALGILINNSPPNQE